MTVTARSRRRSSASCRKHASRPSTFCAARSSASFTLDHGRTLDRCRSTTDHAVDESRFLNRDPLEMLTREPYAYAGNNPLNFTDPTGLFVHEKIGGLVPDCPFGKNPNGSCRGSNVKNDLAVVGIAAGVVAVGAVVVGTLPVSATVAGTAGTVALVAGGVSTGATAFHAGIECTDGGGRGECVSDLVNVGLAGASFGMGRVGGALARSAQFGDLAGPAYAYRDVFSVLSNAYGGINWLAQGSMGGDC